MAQPEATIQSLFDQAARYGAAKLQMVVSDGNDVPIRAVIVVDGVPETAEILAACDAVQAEWDKERDERGD